MNEASEEFRVQCPDDFNCIEKWLSDRESLYRHGNQDDGKLQ